MAYSRILRIIQWTIVLLLAVLLILYVVLRPEWARPVMMTLGAIYIAVRLWMIVAGAVRKRRSGQHDA